MDGKELTEEEVITDDVGRGMKITRNDALGVATPAGTITGGSLVATDPTRALTLTLAFPSEPLLVLKRNADGKVHAEYDPDKVTEAAQALIDEVARIQGTG